MSRKSPDEKRTPSNTAAAQTDLMQDALAAPVQPPAHVKLRPRDKPFWNSLVRARATSLWNDSDLELAANLARCKSDIELEQQLLTREGYVIENARGTRVMNPRVTILEVLSRRAVAMSRMLQVHAGATVGDIRDAKALLEAEQAARDNAAAAKQDENDPHSIHDDLIPHAPAVH